tara:strand:+ start:36040 stop:37074 length:1035 start_codon:yes stop_codon:yes gene_type:complete
MEKKNSSVLVTGAAGFIGSAVCLKLISEGFNVYGIDNLNDYYDVDLKKDRLELINNHKSKYDNWKFSIVDISDMSCLKTIFEDSPPSIVINLAAQAGVRYSLDFPEKYIQSNIVGFANLLELCKEHNVLNFIYASSSSVYGGNGTLPFSENHDVSHPKNLYAATKKSNELMAHAYSYLYNLPSTGLRFFTVYGPWGRPDMAPMKFAKAILKGEPIEVFNFGDMKRDFTFIDDVVDGILRCCLKPATFCPDFNLINPEASKSFAPHRIFNIGNGNPVKLLSFIEMLEKALGRKAIKIMKEMHKADVKETFADTELIEQWIGFKNKTTIEKGIKVFADWYIKYHLE